LQENVIDIYQSDGKMQTICARSLEETVNRNISLLTVGNLSTLPDSSSAFDNFSSV